MRTDIAIVGAGPAGLSLGRRLIAKGIRPAILEANRVGETWRRVPPDLKLLNPWWLCALSTRSLLASSPFNEVDAEFFVKQLEILAKPLSAYIREDTRVTSIAKDGDGYILGTSDGEKIITKTVVFCTGYFGNPAPPMPGISSDDSIPVRHSSEIYDYEKLRLSRDRRERVLVVGKRVTAGQILEQLLKHGAVPHLSCRQPLQFSHPGLVRSLRTALYYFYEPAYLKFNNVAKANSFPPMRGGKASERIEAGLIPVHAPPRAIIKGSVQFEDGSTHEFDQVILATGYRPALERIEPFGSNGLDALQVSDDGELASFPGVFLLGLDNTPNFRSRYLRGIRSDAGKLASVIKSRHDSQSA